MSYRFAAYKPAAPPRGVSARGVQRACAYGGAPGPTGECAECRRKRVQPTLRIGAPDDRFEREADRVADAVMTAPTDGAPLAAPVRVQRIGSGGGAGIEAPASVDAVLASSGRPLDAPTRQVMEARMGHDFSRVRVHTDTRASASARAVGARAYTVGGDVAFGAGEYQPGTEAGQRLLAHELTHVVQQSAADGEVVQRAPEDDLPATPVPLEEIGAPAAKPADKADAKPTDVAMYMDPYYEPAAHLFAAGGKVYEIDSLSKMAATLKAIDFPVARLSVLAHSSGTASIKFTTEGWVDPTSLALILKGALRPEFAPALLDFRECLLGMSPEGLETLRGAVGASAAVGSNCFVVTKNSSPIKMGLDGARKDISSRSQLIDKHWKAAFKGLLEGAVDGFGDAKKCLLDTSEDGYFRTGGKLVTMFANPSASKAYVEGESVCYKDLVEETVDPATAAGGRATTAGGCKLIRVEKPDPSAPLPKDAAPEPEPAPTKDEP